MDKASVITRYLFELELIGTDAVSALESAGIIKKTVLDKIENTPDE